MRAVGSVKGMSFGWCVVIFDQWVVCDGMGSEGDEYLNCMKVRRSEHPLKYEYEAEHE